MAFAEMVPRDHESGKRWRCSKHHIELQQAAFAHQALNVIGFIESGKSEQLTLVRTAWEIGQNPGGRHIIVRAVRPAAADRVQSVRELIESKDYRAVYPHVRRSPVKGATWGKESFTVERPNLADPNPTLAAAGLFEDKLGYRVDRLVFDDIVSLKNVGTSEMREKVTRTVKGTFISRLTRNARWINVQNAWHKNDLGAELHAEGYPTFVIPFYIGERGGPHRWTERFDDAWYQKQSKLLGPSLAPGLLDCQPRSDETSRIKEEYIRTALKKGEGHRFVHQARCPDDHQLITGWDLAVSRKKKSDTNSAVTVLGDSRGHVNIIGMESDSVDIGIRWGGPEIVQRIANHTQRYRGSRQRVENNGTQEFLVQFAREAVAYVESHCTGSNKADPTFGLEGIATEMHNGAIALPCEWVNDEGPLQFDADPEIQALVAEMLDYEPRKHVGDRLMAFWMAWHAIREGTGEVETVSLARW